MDIGFFGMKIFIEGCTDDTIVVDCDAELRSDCRYISIVSTITSFMSEDHKIAPSFHILGKCIDFFW